MITLLTFVILIVVAIGHHIWIGCIRDEVGTVTARIEMFKEQIHSIIDLSEKVEEDIQFLKDDIKSIKVLVSSNKEVPVENRTN